MMNPDKELALLEAEFPKSRRAWVRETPAALDERILSIAARHASSLAAQHAFMLERAKFSPDVGQGGRPGQLGSADRGRVLGFSPTKATMKQMSVSENQPPPPPPGAGEMMDLLREASAQEWRSRISIIALLGDSELARYLLDEYRVRFLDS